MTLKLKVGMTDDGRLLAIAYEERGEDIHVMDVEVVPNGEAARTWFDEISKTRPWEERQ